MILWERRSTSNAGATMSETRTTGLMKAYIFSEEGIPFEDTPWGRTKVLIGHDVDDDRRYNPRVMIKVTENADGPRGSHQLHSHPEQDEILYVLEGYGENEAEDGTVQQFGPGDVLHIPAGVIHEDRSKGGPLRLLVIKLPPDIAD